MSDDAKMRTRKAGRVQLSGMAQVGALILFLFSLGGYWSFLGLYSDLVSHFRLQYAVLQLILLVAFIFWKQPKWLLMAFLGLALNVGELAPAWFSPDTDSTGATTAGGKLRLMQMNVHTENNQYEKAAAAIRALNPDVISLQEVNGRWLEKLAPTLKAYPYKVVHPREDNFGIALYSRAPFQKTKVHFFGDKAFEIPSILAAIQLDKQLVTILSTHPLPPVSDTYFNSRNEQLLAIAEKRMQLGENLIIIGDLNTTPYSETFKSFIEASGLRDSRDGFGYQGSWPSFFPLLLIPIDHVLVSERFIVNERKIGPVTGSDHVPVLTEVSLPLLPPPAGPTSARKSSRTSQPDNKQKPNSSNVRKPPEFKTMPMPRDINEE